MDELKRALEALVRQAGLTEAEVANLTLQDVHLAGNEPAITLLDDDSGSQRKVTLNDEVRNVLVAWMLARPDKPVTLLFPGDQGEGLTVREIKALLPELDASEQPIPVARPQPVSAEVLAEEGLPQLGPSVARRAASRPLHAPPATLSGRATPHLARNKSQASQDRNLFWLQPENQPLTPGQPDRAG